MRLVFSKPPRSPVFNHKGPLKALSALDLEVHGLEICAGVIDLQSPVDTALSVVDIA